MRLLLYLTIFLSLLCYVALIDIVEVKTENQVTVHNIKQTGCVCVKYKCKCCEYLNWKLVHLDGLMCAKIKYIIEDIGISMSVDYNSTVIIEENLSVRTLFPLCTTQAFIKAMPVVICIQMFDVIISSEKVHMCFQIEGTFYKFKLPTVPLGCINMINSQNSGKDNQLKRFLFDALDDLNQWTYNHSLAQ